MHHYGGFKVLKSTLEVPFSILALLLPSSCLIMLQCLSLLSMLGPSFLDKTNTSDLSCIIFSGTLGIVQRNGSTLIELLLVSSSDGPCISDTWACVALAVSGCNRNRDVLITLLPGSVINHFHTTCYLKTLSFKRWCLQFQIWAIWVFSGL